MDAAKNFANVTVSLGYDASATSIVLTTGHATRLPAAPFNAVYFNFTDYPDPASDPNVEIVRVTLIASDTLTITRAQESTLASTKNTSGKTYKLIAGPTAKVITDIITEIDARQPILFHALPTVNWSAIGPQTDIFLSGNVSISKGKCVRLDSAAQWQLADASSEAESVGFLGITLEVEPLNEPIHVGMPGSLICVNSWNWTLGATLYLSVTGGSLTETPPSGTNEVIRVVGYAVSAQVIYWLPSTGYTVNP